MMSGKLLLHFTFGLMNVSGMHDSKTGEVCEHMFVSQGS